MNERIKELAREAGLLVHNPEGVPTKLEKFAQLIVQECAKVILETPVKYTEIDIMHIIRDNVKKHFGVEDRAVPILSADEQALFAGITSSKLFTIAGAKKQFGVVE